MFEWETKNGNPSASEFRSACDATIPSNLNVYLYSKPSKCGGFRVIKCLGLSPVWIGSLYCLLPYQVSWTTSVLTIAIAKTTKSRKMSAPSLKMPYEIISVYHQRCQRQTDPSDGDGRLLMQPFFRRLTCLQWATQWTAFCNNKHDTASEDCLQWWWNFHPIPSYP